MCRILSSATFRSTTRRWFQVVRAVSSSKLLITLSAVLLGSQLFAQVKVGDIAPDIILTHSWNAKDGRTTLADFHGAFVMLFFFGTDCHHCLGEIPDLISQEEKYGNRGIRILAASDQPDSTIDEFLKKEKHLGINYTVGKIAGGELKSYGVGGVPCVILVGPNGKIVSTAARDQINNATDLDKHLKAISPPKIDAAVVKGARKAVASFNAMEYGKAFEAATKLSSDAEAKQEDKDGAKVVLDRINEIESSLTRRLDNIVANKEFAHLEAVVISAGKSWKGHSLEKTLETHQKYLKSKEGTKELKASKDFAKLEYRYRKATDANVRAVVVAEITKFITANEQTAAAGKAKALVGK